MVVIAVLKHMNKRLFVSLNKRKNLLVENFIWQGYRLSCYHTKGRIISKANFSFVLNNKGFPREIYISYMETKEEYRNKGYGKILVDFLKALAKASKLPISLISYEESKRFWKKCGFRVVRKENLEMCWKPD